MDGESTIPSSGGRKRNRRRTALICALITLILAVIFWQAGTLKCGYGLHVDEVFTFMLANHQHKNGHLSLSPKDGKVYSGEELWNEFMTTAGNNKRFDYANVFFNQSKDVHPPLYYVLIHTVSSLFPNMDVAKIGLIVNIPLACIAFCQFVWLASKLGLKKYNAIAISALYVLGAGFISYAVFFLRMYCLMTVWVNFLIMVLLEFPPEEKAPLKYCACLGFALLGGALTQHYFIIYAFFACALYAAFVIRSRNWQKLISSIGTAGIAAGLEVAIFPAVIRHLLKSGRGKEAIGKALSFSQFRKFIGSFIMQIDDNAFGGLLLAVLILLMVMLIVSSRTKDKHKPSKAASGYCLLVIPALLYIVIISAIAPYKDYRYIVPAAGALYIAVLSGLINLIRRLSARAVVFVLLLACLMSVTTYRGGAVNLRRDYERLPIPYKDLTCVFIYHIPDRWTTNSAFIQLRLFDKVVFVSDKNWGKYKNTDYHSGSLAVYLPKDNQVHKRFKLRRKDVLSELKKHNGLSSCTQIDAAKYLFYDIYYITGSDGQENKQAS